MGGPNLGGRSTFKLGVGKQSSVFPTRRFSVDFKVNWFVDFIANRQRLSLVVLWNVFHPLPQGEVWSRLTEIQVGSMFLSSRSLNQIVHYGIPVHQSILNRSLYATLVYMRMRKAPRVRPRVTCWQGFP